ncbi:efflux RND transporter periplasmic adaptor subunit [Rubrivivax gelatinosus]|uniref:Macrolide-specific efflux protein MacA n=1 Tax=Rubrivivax gelatinosus (strain NBRC 100245 / IL144) TaxID=983917 RepID=I0HSY6_RUBGI|nr:efflux RND transporter periplasmic adaptor subunit [Rubrivivax gelatinosus]BAL96123.1 macrolide-specific efflux protein MacA [Rubrivivax gelatinosus IL144]
MTPTTARRLRYGAAGLALLLAAVAVQRLVFSRPEPPALITAPATRADLQDTVLANGTLQAFKQVSVGAQVSGQVKSLKVALGDEVKKGQLVAEIDSMTQQNTLRNARAALVSVQAQLRSAQATLAQARRTLARQQQMRHSEASAPADLESAQEAVEVAEANVVALQAQLEQARISVDTAEVNLGYTRISSPIDGQVVAIVTEEGTTVNANQSTPTILIVAQVDTMTVKASISEADVTSVKPGQKAWFTILGEPRRRFEARLRSVEPATDSISSTSTSTSSSSSTSTTSATAIYYNAKFEVPNPDRLLRISMTAEVHVVRGEAKGALTIPVGALGARQDDGRTTVQVLGPDGQPQPRAVRIGLNNNVAAQVLDGLKEGERVVLGNAASPTASTSGRRMGPPPMF